MIFPIFTGIFSISLETGGQNILNHATAANPQKKQYRRLILPPRLMDITVIPEYSSKYNFREKHCRYIHRHRKKCTHPEKELLGAVSVFIEKGCNRCNGKSPHNTEISPHHTAALIQYPAVIRQKIVSVISPRNAPIKNSSTIYKSCSRRQKSPDVPLRSPCAASEDMLW